MSVSQRLKQDEGIGQYVAERINRQRKLRGFSVQTLADKSGVGHRGISMIESGNRLPSAAVLFSIARALGVPMEYLMGSDSDYVFYKASTECICGRTVTITFEG